jgi:DNA-binding XRE family transcriptional regulator
LDLSTVQAAKVLGVTEATLLAWERRQETPEEIKLLAVTKLIRGDLREIPGPALPEGSIPKPIDIQIDV